MGKAYYNVTVALMDDSELDHLEDLVARTGLRRNRIMRLALLAFTPGQVQGEVEKMRESQKGQLRADLELALEVAQGNISFVSRLTGINRNSVYWYMKQFGLVNPKVPGKWPRGRQFNLIQKVYRERKERQQRDLRVLRGADSTGDRSGAAGGGQPSP